MTGPQEAGYCMGEFAMFKKVVFLVVLSLGIFREAPAESLPVGNGWILDIDPPAGWRVTTVPPEFLVAEMAEHLGHEAAEQGRHPTIEQLHKAAAGRLAVNEGFVFRDGTGAHLVVDFSPLRPEEAPAGEKEVADSARYAAEGMSAEEGVEVVRSETSPAAIAGAATAQRVEVDYLHHGRRMKFIGLVGFADPCWFYLYYTDSLADPADLASARSMLETVRLRREP